MRTHFYIALTLLLLTVVINSSEATTRKIPQDYAKIQLAINAAVNGDTVLVAEGKYFENLVIKKKIVLGSLFLIDNDTSHISKTIIDGSTPSHSDSASVICISVGSDSTTMIAGFTIQKGYGTRFYDGGYWRAGLGIYITAGSANIHHNIIMDNSLTSSNGVFGGGIAIWPSNGALSYWIIENNQIKNNSISSTATKDLAAEGGGVWLTEDGRFNNNLVMHNSAIGIVYGSGGGISLGGASGYGSTTVEMSNNNIHGNQASHWGGGIIMYIDPTKLAIPYVTFKNNIISSNSASVVGAAIHIQGGTYTFINNTITGNTGPQAIEVQSFRGLLTLRLLNNIVWNPNCMNEILEGGGGYTKSIGVSYSDIRGGYAGTGNIDVDPCFAANDSLYRLSDSSYCIARGMDSVQFNSTWYRAPLKDYFGTIRPTPVGSHPDIGAVENSSGAIIPFPLPLMGTKIGAFFDRVNSANSSDRTAIVDSFFIANPFMPFLEDTIVHFLYRGTATAVNVSGDFNSWAAGVDAMEKISTTDLWFKARSFEKDARIEYKFILNGSNWILDPKNPKTTPGGLGDNSTVYLPLYPVAPELLYDATIPHGTIVDTLFSSSYMNNSRTISVYTPSVYDPSGTAKYPVAVFHDGSEWITFAQVKNSLDYLIAKKRIQPLIAVFVSPFTGIIRQDEYLGSLRPAFCNFIVSEIIPYIKSRYHTIDNAESRASLGVSNGAALSLWLGYNYPTTFGKVGAFSGGWSAEINAFSGEKKSLDIYLDAGTYEGYNQSVRVFHTVIVEKGYNHIYKEWHEGHSWGSWRAHLDNALEFLFPGTALSVNDIPKHVPSEFILSQNYPNPFNPSTTIRYSLPSSANVKLVVYDLLGREIATLVTEEQSAGWKEVQWNAKDVSSGIYFYKLTAGYFVETKKMIVVK